MQITSTQTPIRNLDKWTINDFVYLTDSEKSTKEMLYKFAFENNDNIRSLCNELGWSGGTIHQVLEEIIKRKKAIEIEKEGIKSWLDYTFESSSGLTPEFAEFAKQFKKELEKLLDGYEIINFSRGHFYISLFAKNITTSKLVYISCSDVRYFLDSWYHCLLIRTAEHEKDYTGGVNNYSSLELLKEKADYLTYYSTE